MTMILTTIAVFIGLTALFVLLLLALMDLRTGLLPNVWVLIFALLGIAFHSFTKFQYTTHWELGAGLFVGGGILFVIRAFAMRYYGDDALGLGDVKLMAAGGIWLGPDGILIAMTLGALAGFLHGLIVWIIKSKKSDKPVPLSTLSLPAGPGFVFGIAFTGLQAFAPIANNLF